MPTPAEDPSPLHGTWKLSSVFHSSTCTLDTLVLIKPTLPKGRGDISDMSIDLPLPTIDHLFPQLPPLLSKMPDAPCPRTESPRHCLGPGLLLGPLGSIALFLNVQRKRSSSPREWAGSIGIDSQFLRGPQRFVSGTNRILPITMAPPSEMYRPSERAPLCYQQHPLARAAWFLAPW